MLEFGISEGVKVLERKRGRRRGGALLRTMSRSTCFVVGAEDGKTGASTTRLRALAHPRNSGDWQKLLSKEVR